MSDEQEQEIEEADIIEVDEGMSVFEWCINVMFLAITFAGVVRLIRYAFE